MPDSRIALVTHPKSHAHAMPFSRPNIESFESPLRIQMAEAHLRDHGFMDRLMQVKAPRATEETILLAHSSYVLDSVKLMSEIGRGQLGESSYSSPELFASALLAAGGAQRSVELVVKGDAIHAFSLMRPPGHHASTSTPSGLCYFNNVAIAVKYAMEKLGVRRASILDFDDHFGNGTAEIFYGNPDVQYVSIHEYDYEEYGLGHYMEVGHGKAAGTKVNIPLLEMSPDASYKAAIDRVVVPAINRFRPGLIAVSAGYDAHFADPVGNMDVTSKTFWYLGKTVAKLAEKLGCPGSSWVLEGGYNPMVIGSCIEASLEGLAGKAMPKLSDQVERKTDGIIVEANERIVDQVLETLDPYW